MGVKGRKFNELTVGDPVFRVKSGFTTIDKDHVEFVKKEIIEIRFGAAHCSLNRVENTAQKWSSDRQPVYYFSHEPDAIRFAKAQVIKDLNARIEAAKEKIEEVKKFRMEHFDVLNHDWTDHQINKLEKELGY